MTNRLISEQLSEKPKSLFGQVMESADAKDAYFNTTSGHLYSDPTDPSTETVLKALNRAGVAYIFSACNYYPKPILQTFEFGRFVGEDEILHAIGKLLIPLPSPVSA